MSTSRRGAERDAPPGSLQHRETAITDDLRRRIVLEMAWLASSAVAVDRRLQHPWAIGTLLRGWCPMVDHPNFIIRCLLLTLLAVFLLVGVLAAAADTLFTARRIADAAALSDAQAISLHLAPALRVPDTAPFLALAAARLEGNTPSFVAALAQATAQALATPEGIARMLSARLPPEALLDRVQLQPDGSVVLSLRSP